MAAAPMASADLRSDSGGDHDHKYPGMKNVAPPPRRSGNINPKCESLKLLKKVGGIILYKYDQKGLRRGNVKNK